MSQKNTIEMLINRTEAITGENRERGKQGEGKTRRGENREWRCEKKRFS